MEKPSRRDILAAGAALPIAAAVPGAALARGAVPVNPLVRQRADAQISRVGGWFYLTC